MSSGQRPAKSTRPLLLGHRGARGKKVVPENTFASFDLALASGCDGFEFDVRLSADGQAVVCHDAKIHGKEIARCSAAVLALPLLREVLIRYQSRAFLDIELKVRGLENITSDLLRQHPPARGYAVSSFLPDVLQSIHMVDATIALGLICETRLQVGRWQQLPVEYVIPHCTLMRQRTIAEIKAAGKKILVWTVNMPTDMKRFSQWGVDGIISDDPNLLALTLKAKV